jgi:hypothetical protein
MTDEQQEASKRARAAYEADLAAAGITMSPVRPAKLTPADFSPIRMRRPTLTPTATANLAPDEQAVRKPEFTEGIKIILADGKAWHFPKPQAIGFIFVRVDGKTKLKRGFGWGEPYEKLVDAYVVSTTVSEEAVALFDLALYLLERNYAITFDDLRHLLHKARSDEPEETRAANEAMWRTISDVALGNSPQPSV